jgi:hypothetical protein
MYARILAFREPECCPKTIPLSNELNLHTPQSTRMTACHLCPSLQPQRNPVVAQPRLQGIRRLKLAAADSSPARYDSDSVGFRVQDSPARRGARGRRRGAMPGCPVLQSLAPRRSAASGMPRTAGPAPFQILLALQHKAIEHVTGSPQKVSFRVSKHTSDRGCHNIFVQWQVA